jgi:hypothetical protein
LIATLGRDPDCVPATRSILDALPGLANFPRYGQIPGPVRIYVGLHLKKLQPNVLAPTGSHELSEDIRY